MENDTPEFLYRYEERQTAELLDTWENPIKHTSGLSLYLWRFQIVRRTPKGVWIDIGYGDLKFVRLDARKRYACPTLEEAWESFDARKARQVSILTNQLRVAKAARHLYPGHAIVVGHVVTRSDGHLTHS